MDEKSLHEKMELESRDTRERWRFSRIENMQRDWIFGTGIKIRRASQGNCAYSFQQEGSQRRWGTNRAENQGRGRTRHDTKQIFRHITGRKRKFKEDIVKDKLFRQSMCPTGPAVRRGKRHAKPNPNVVLKPACLRRLPIDFALLHEPACPPSPSHPSLTPTLSLFSMLRWKLTDERPRKT